MNSNLSKIKLLHTVLRCTVLMVFLLKPFTNQAQLNCAGVVITPTAAVCPGQGAIDIVLPSNFGGLAPYTFSGTGPTSFAGQTNSPISSLKTGLYNITITDASGNNAPCVFPLVNVTTTHVPMQAPTITWSGCQAFGTIVGGKSPYTISVIDGNNPNAPPLSSITNVTNTTFSFTNLANGSKAVKITDACGQTVTSAAGLVSYTPIGLTANFTLPDKVSTAVVSSTNSLYTYSLYINSILKETVTTTDKTYTFLGVSPDCNGNYVTVSDTTCNDSKTAQLLIPNATPEIKVDCINFTDGTASVSATKGKAPYTFECYTNLGVKIADSNTGNFTGLVGTSFYFKVKDACGKTSLNSLTYTKPVLQLSSVLPDCGNSKVTLTGAFSSSGTGPIFLPLTFTALNSGYTSTSSTAVFTKNDIPTNFVLSIKDKCNNGYTIKDSIQFDFLPNQPCKTIKTAPPLYIVKYVNGATILSSWLTAAPNSLTYNLYDEAGSFVATNNTGIFTNLNYDKEYTVKLITPCGLETTKKIKLPAPSGGPNPFVLYSCVGNSIVGSISSTGLTPPMSIVSVPPGTPASFNTPLPIGSYLVEDCTGSKVVEIKASNAPNPTEVSYNTSSLCIGNKFKHTIYAYSNNLGNGPYTLKDVNGNLIPSVNNNGKEFKDLDAGTYFLTSTEVCTKETKIILVDPPKVKINETIEGPFCNAGTFFLEHKRNL